MSALPIGLRRFARVGAVGELSLNTSIVETAARELGFQLGRAFGEAPEFSPELRAAIQVAEIQSTVAAGILRANPADRTEAERRGAIESARLIMQEAEANIIAAAEKTPWPGLTKLRLRFSKFFDTVKRELGEMVDRAVQTGKSMLAVAVAGTAAAALALYLITTLSRKVAA